MPTKRPPAARTGSRRLENPACEHTCIYSLATVYTHLYTVQAFFFPSAISQIGDRHRIEGLKRKTLAERHADRSHGDIRHEPPAPQFGAVPLHNLVPAPFLRQRASGRYFLGEACPKCRDGALADGSGASAVRTAATEGCASCTPPHLNFGDIPRSRRGKASVAERLQTEHHDGEHGDQRDRAPSEDVPRTAVAMPSHDVLVLGDEHQEHEKHGQ